MSDGAAAWARRRCQRGARARALDAVRRRAGAHEPGERRVDGLGRLHAAARHAEPAQPRGEAVGLRVDGAQIGAGGHEAAVLLAGERGGQRADDAVERRLVDEPLVGAVLADRLRGVQRRHVRRGRRGELRRQLRDDALGAQPREQRRALGEALDERPAERVHEHRDDARRRGVELGQHVGGQAARRRASPNSCSSVPGMRAKP